MRSTAHNIGLAIWRLKCFYETFVQGLTLGILLNFCAKIPPHRQAENRYGQLYETTTKRTGTTRRLTLQDQLTSQWTTFKPLHSDNFQTLKSNK